MTLVMILLSKKSRGNDVTKVHSKAIGNIFKQVLHFNGDTHFLEKINPQAALGNP